MSANVFPMVGRDAEIRTLGSELSGSSKGVARTVFIRGPAGIGKTRLLAEFRARHERRATFLLGRGSPIGTALAYSLFVEALEGHLRKLSLPEVAALAKGRGAPLASVLPSVAAALGVASGGDAASPSSVLVGFSFLLERLSAESAGKRGGPLVLVLDDLHQADPSTFELLDYLARNPVEAPLLIVAAVRTEALAATPDLAALMNDLSKDELAMELRLPPLSRDEVVSLADARLGPDQVDAAFGEWLFDRSRGNALFATALLADSSDSSDSEAPREEIPPTVAERVGALVAALPAEEREILETASVLGHSFSFRTLATLLPDEVSGRTWVDDLSRSGLLEVHEEAGGAVYDFAHPLMQEATYQGIGAERRRGLHLAAADPSAGAPLAARAYHAARGALAGDDQSIDVILAAARDAETNQWHPEALVHLQAAISLLTPSDTDQRIELLKEVAWQAGSASDHSIGIPALRELEMLVADDPEQLGRVKVQLASFLSTGAGELAEAEASVREAISLFEQAGATDAVAGAMNELAWISAEQGRLQDAIDLSSKAVDLARKDGNQGVELHALGALGHALGVLGRARESIDVGERALGIAKATGDREQIGWHTGVLAQAHISGGSLPDAVGLIDPFFAGGESLSDVAYFSSAWLNLLVGRWDRALADCRAVHAMHPTTQSIHTTWTLSMAGFLLTSMGRAAEANPLLATADRTYGERDFYIFSGFHEWMSGCAARIRGDTTDARKRLAHASDLLWRIDAMPMFAQVVVDAIELEVAIGEKREAGEFAKRLSSVASDLGDPLSATLASYGSALVEKGTKTRGAMFADVANQAREAGARWHQARATEFAGEENDDVGMLAEAGRLFAGLPSSTDEARVLGKLRSAGSKGVRVAQTVGELTAREREIASLAGRGMSDREIADRLQLSVRTVQSHLAHVYGKLQIAGRADLLP